MDTGNCLVVWKQDISPCVWKIFLLNNAVVPKYLLMDDDEIVSLKRGTLS